MLPYHRINIGQVYRQRVHHLITIHELRFLFLTHGQRSSRFPENLMICSGIGDYFINLAVNHVLASTSASSRHRSIRKITCHQLKAALDCHLNSLSFSSPFQRQPGVWQTPTQAH